jgi:hypothetical protein
VPLFLKGIFMALSKASTDPNYLVREEVSEEVIETTEETEKVESEIAEEAIEESESGKPPSVESNFGSDIWALYKKLHLLGPSDYMGGGVPKTSALTRVAGYRITKQMRDELMSLINILKRD